MTTKVKVPQPRERGRKRWATGCELAELRGAERERARCMEIIKSWCLYAQTHAFGDHALHGILRKVEIEIFDGRYPDPGHSHTLGVAKVMRADGSVSVLDHKPTLKEAQEIVGGYVELVNVRDPDTGKMAQLLIDEEGRIKGKPANLYASVYWLVDGIDGDAILLTGKMQWR